jgi:hypothetical protein
MLLFNLPIGKYNQNIKKYCVVAGPPGQILGYSMSGTKRQNIVFSCYVMAG